MDMRYKYYYVDLSRQDCEKLYNKVADNTIKINSFFVKQQIEDIYNKFNKDNKILTIGLPLKNQTTKEILTILEKNNLHFEITTHHN